MWMENEAEDCMLGDPNPVLVPLSWFAETAKIGTTKDRNETFDWMGSSTI